MEVEAEVAVALQEAEARGQTLADPAGNRQVPPPGPFDHGEAVDGLKVHNGVPTLA